MQLDIEMSPSAKHSTLNLLCKAKCFPSQYEGPSDHTHRWAQKEDICVS